MGTGARVDAHHARAAARPFALDELFGDDRRGAYLHIVDTAELVAQFPDAWRAAARVLITA